MNIFELSIIVTPIVGAIKGGASVKSSDTMNIAIGIATGLLIGIALDLGIIKISNWLAHVHRLTSSKIIVLLAETSWVFLLPILSPFASGWLSAYVVTRLMNL
jgi:hypothetical protein